jgi:hypothetical protein
MESGSIAELNIGTPQYATTKIVAYGGVPIFN